MDWIVENWSIIAFIISLVFSIAIFVLKQKGKKNLAEKLEEMMGVARDRDEVLRRTFLNVEELKKIWASIGKDRRIGEMFKGWNEDVGMEPLVRENYLRLIGSELGLIENEKTGKIEPKEKPPEVGNATVG